MTACRVCGCTEQNACTVEVAGIARGCHWIEPTLCSACSGHERRLRGPQSQRGPENQSRLGFWSTLHDGTQVNVEASRDHEGTVYLTHVWKVPEAAREDLLAQLELDDRDRLLDGAAALYDAAMGGPRP